MNRPRIRRQLIHGGLVGASASRTNQSFHGAPTATYEIVLGNRPKPNSAKSRPTAINYVVEDEHRRRLIVHNEFDANSKGSRESRRAVQGPAHARSKSTEQITAAKPARSPVRAKSAHRLTRSSAPTEELPMDELCQMTMIYYGSQSNPYSTGDSVTVMQQHSTGDTLLVYKGLVRPNETFTFECRRHPDFPFAVTLYVNGCIDSRITACCEYAASRDVRLAGNRSSFTIYDMQKSNPCRNCELETNRKEISIAVPDGKNQSHEKKIGASRSTSAHSASRRPVGVLCKADLMKSERGRTYAESQPKKRSKTLDSTSRQKHKSGTTPKIKLPTLERQPLSKTRTDDRERQNDSLTSRSQSPDVSVEPEEFPYSSETWLSTRFNSIQQSDTIATSWVTPTNVSDDKYYPTQTSSSSVAHPPKQRHSLSSADNASSSASLPSFDDDRDSITAKHFTSASSASSSMHQTDTDQHSSSSSTIVPSAVNTVRPKQERRPRSPTSFGRSSRSSIQCMVSEHKPRPLSLLPNTSTISGGNANSTLTL